MSGAILVSACLLGLPTRYDGCSKEDTGVLTYLQQQGLIPIPVCPEQLGGLPTPRPPAQLSSPDGHAVLHDNARVRTDNNQDVTAAFRQGALAALAVAQRCGCRRALLKERSPSCGVHVVYQGDLPVAGRGVTAALLQEHGLQLQSEADLEVPA